MTEMKQRRTAAGLTLAELARRTGVNYSTVQALEVGRGENYDIEIKKKIADALGVTGNEFFTLWPEELKKFRHVQEFVLKVEDAQVELTAEKVKLKTAAKAPRKGRRKGGPK